MQQWMVVLLSASCAVLTLGRSIDDGAASSSVSGRDYHDDEAVGWPSPPSSAVDGAHRAMRRGEEDESRRRHLDDTGLLGNTRSQNSEIIEQARQFLLRLQHSRNGSAGLSVSYEDPSQKVILANLANLHAFERAPQRGTKHINVHKRHCWDVADVCCMWNIC